MGSEWAPPSLSPSAALRNASVSPRGKFTCIWCPGFIPGALVFAAVAPGMPLDQLAVWRGGVHSWVPWREWLAGFHPQGAAQTTDGNTPAVFWERGLRAGLQLRPEGQASSVRPTSEAVDCPQGTDTAGATLAPPPAGLQLSCTSGKAFIYWPGAGGGEVGGEWRYQVVNRVHMTEVQG